MSVMIKLVVIVMTVKIRTGMRMRRMKTQGTRKAPLQPSDVYLMHYAFLSLHCGAEESGV